WIGAARRHGWAETRAALGDRRAAAATAAGAVLGPTLGVTRSLIALGRTSVGVASTLMAVTPVFLLPVTWIVFGERPTWRAYVGTGIAVAGVAGLFLF
ncbi:MAG: EamA family transporter, partial [Candidatus Bipolaricaulia bacterium]